MQLDRIDARILTALQRDCRMTSEALARQVHLSPTAVQRRLKRLRAQGVIEAEVAVVDPRAAGRPIVLIVQVMLDRERAEVIDRFKGAIRERPEVMMGCHVTGEADFVLMVSQPSMEAFEAFTRDFLYGFPELKSFKTMVVMDRVKTGFFVPVETAA